MQSPLWLMPFVLRDDLARRSEIHVVIIISYNRAAVSPVTQRKHESATPYTWAEKFESFERINSIRETNGNFDSCNSCERLGTSRSHELHESKFPFVSRIEFIRSKLSNFSAHVYGVSTSGSAAAAIVNGTTREAPAQALPPWLHGIVFFWLLRFAFSFLSSLKNYQCIAISWGPIHVRVKRKKKRS